MKLSSKFIIALLIVFTLGTGVIYYKVGEFITSDFDRVYKEKELDLKRYVQSQDEPPEQEVDYKTLPRFSNRVSYEEVNKSSGVEGGIVGRSDPFNQLYITEIEIEELKEQLKKEEITLSDIPENLRSSVDETGDTNPQHDEDIQDYGNMGNNNMDNNYSPQNSIPGQGSGNQGNHVEIVSDFIDLLR